MANDDFDMTGRVALITGAGRGMGLAIGKAFATKGCAVAIQDIDKAAAAEAATAISDAGGRAIAVVGDVSDLAYPASCVADVLAKLGGLHVLVNNAAIQHRKPWIDERAEDFMHVLSTNIVSPILFCQAAVPIFKEQRWGRILNVGSIQGFGGNANMLPYSLSKSAMVTMTKALARDLGRDGITVNNLAPGWMNTYRNRNDFADENDKEEKGKRVLLGRIGEAEDVTGAALLLCSKAGEYITGQTITIDGGITT
jgi:NAD(P)-dependent dehydrogenase (short-subunit alcohol dehydrogenase family)